MYRALGIAEIGNTSYIYTIDVLTAMLFLNWIWTYKWISELLQAGWHHTGTVDRDMSVGAVVTQDDDDEMHSFSIQMIYFSRPSWEWILSVYSTLLMSIAEVSGDHVMAQFTQSSNVQKEQGNDSESRE